MSYSEPLLQQKSPRASTPSLPEAAILTHLPRHSSSHRTLPNRSMSRLSTGSLPRQRSFLRIWSSANIARHALLIVCDERRPHLRGLPSYFAQAAPWLRRIHAGPPALRPLKPLVDPAIPNFEERVPPNCQGGH